MSRRKDAVVQTAEISVSDLGSAVRVSRGDLVRDERVNFPRSRTRCPNKVDWYLFHGFITDRQALAGLKFHTLFRRASEPQRLTARYAERIEGRRYEISEGRVHAMKELRSAMRLLDGDAARAVATVAGLDDYVGRGRLEDLRRALSTLADHWGMPA